MHFGNLAGTDHRWVLARAKDLGAAGRGRELMLLSGCCVVSAESYTDRMSTIPAILNLVPAIAAPVLFIRGDQNPRDGYRFAKAAGGPDEAR